MEDDRMKICVASSLLLLLSLPLCFGEEIIEVMQGESAHLQIRLINPTDEALRGLKVELADAPRWLRCDGISGLIIPADSSVMVPFSFKLDRGAPLGKRDLKLEVVTGDGYRWERKVRLIVKPIPREFRVYQNYPNPFNPETWIPFQIPEASRVVVRIYDVMGRLVRELDLGEKETGYYLDRSRAVYWDGRNDLGEEVSSGVYFYQVEAGRFSSVRRMVILR
jgi:hypothetical protein